MERFRRTRAMASRQILDEAVLIPIRTGAREALGAYHLNPTAACLWARLEREASLDELAALLCERFEVGADRARADAEAFCRELVALGALEPVDPGP